MIVLWLVRGNTNEKHFIYQYILKIVKDDSI